MEWEFEDVAGYIAKSLTTSALQGRWPDNANGNAARLLVQDLGEFGQTMVACARASFWSPAKALERLFMDRVELLMGMYANQKVAKRYLDSIKLPVERKESTRPRDKARPEDSLADFFAKVNLGKEELATFRRTWVELKASNSDWFVHPTVLGPLLSRRIQETPAESDLNWQILVELLISGAFFAITAGNQLGVVLPPDIVRAFLAAGKCLDERGNRQGREILDVYAALVARVQVED